MKISECIPESGSALAAGVVRELQSLFPDDVDVLARVIDVPVDGGIKEPRIFYVLTKDSLTVITAQYEQNDGALQVATTVRVLPRSRMGGVQRFTRHGVHNPGDAWQLEPARYTILVEAERSFGHISFPEQGRQLPREIADQYETLGRTLVRLLLK